MAVRRVKAPSTIGTGGSAAAIGCWGGCWYGGCWGGCWPGITADPALVRSLADSLSKVEGAPEDLGRMFSALKQNTKK